MTPDAVADIMRHALMAAFWIALPLLAVGFAVGIVVSLIQIATSMQDTAFSTVPRLAALLASTLLFLPWILHQSMTYTMSILGDLGRYAK